MLAVFEQKLLGLLDDVWPNERIYADHLRKLWPRKFGGPLPTPKELDIPEGLAPPVGKKLRPLLERRSLFPSIGVRTDASLRSADRTWYIYRVSSAAQLSSEIERVQANILALFPTMKHPDLLDGFALAQIYGDAYREKVDPKRLGFKTLARLLQAMPKLTTKMKGDKMYIRPAAGLAAFFAGSGGGGAGAGVGGGSGLGGGNGPGGGGLGGAGLGGEQMTPAEVEAYVAERRRQWPTRANAEKLRAGASAVDPSATAASGALPGAGAGWRVDATPSQSGAAAAASVPQYDPPLMGPAERESQRPAGETCACGAYFAARCPTRQCASCCGGANGCAVKSHRKRKADLQQHGSLEKAQQDKKARHWEEFLESVRATEEPVCGE